MCIRDSFFVDPEANGNRRRKGFRDGIFDLLEHLRRRQLPENEWQNATVAEVLRFLGRINANKDVELLRRSVLCGGNHFRARLSAQSIADTNDGVLFFAG